MPEVTTATNRWVSGCIIDDACVCLPSVPSTLLDKHEALNNSTSKSFLPAVSEFVFTATILSDGDEEV